MAFDLEKLRAIDDETERLNTLYEDFQEEKRLISRVGRVEYLTTLTILENHLTEGMSVLDVGAGTGAYSLALADMGCQVTALEPATANFRKLQALVNAFGKGKITAYPIGAPDFQQFPDQTFDMVLLFGPLYHLQDPDDRYRTLMEARRVCKDGGHIFVSAINHDMVHFVESMYNPDWLDGNDYDHENFRLEDFPFVFHTVEDLKRLLKQARLPIKNIIASDGLSEMMAEKLNKMSESAYRQYLRRHWSLCENPHFLASSSHLLFHCAPNQSIRMSYPFEEEVRSEIEAFCKNSVDFSHFFKDVRLVDRDLSLRLKGYSPAMPDSDWAPAYYFRVIVDDEEVGVVDLRVGYSESLYYGGNIGYRIHEKFRGNNYATRACRLLAKVAKLHKMSLLCITNDINNLASKRICEKLGAQSRRMTMVPKNSPIRKDGQIFQNVYFWQIAEY